MKTLPTQPEIDAVLWQEGGCLVLDQTLLPHLEHYVRCDTYSQIVERIKTLSIRGAPALGVAGAYGIVLAAQQALALDERDRPAFLDDAVKALADARPTAVNLRWATERMRRVWKTKEDAVTPATVERLLEEGMRIHDEDAEANRLISGFGAALLESGPVMTYCNTGYLATGGCGTAFGVLAEGYLQGKTSHVFACETRPLLQGIRLTAWELARANIPYTVLCDNMAASVMREFKIKAVIVGADRIARNGDTANKIGTYGLAILARHHGVPFYVAAPRSTFDQNTETGAGIPIEQRAAEEVLSILGKGEFAPNVHNPSFDVTPHNLITAFICETGVIRPPFPGQIDKALGN